MINVKRPFLKLFLAQIAIIFVVVGVGIVYFAIKMHTVEEAFDYFLSYAISDFGQCMYFTLTRNPYTSEFHTMYTPLNFALLWPFALFCKQDPTFLTLNAFNGAEYNKALLTSSAFWMSYLPYVFVFVALYVFLLKKLLPRDMEESNWFALALILSNVGVYAISRGSNVTYVLLLLLFFVWQYRSSVAWKKELALICLAAAGVCKYYPLIFGALLLKRKDFLGAVRVAIYVVLLFFIPFFFYEGGASNIAVYFSNLGGFVVGENRIAEGGNLSGYSLVYKIAILFGADENVRWLRYVALCFSLAILAVTAVGSIVTRDRFSQYMLFCCAMTLVSPVTYYYLVLFLVFPIMEYTVRFEEMDKFRKYYYLVFFSICAFLPTIALPTYVGQTLLFIGAIVIEWIHISKEKKESI